MLEARGMGVGTSLEFLAWLCKDRGVSVRVRAGCEVGNSSFSDSAGPRKEPGNKDEGSRSKKSESDCLSAPRSFLAVWEQRHSALCPQSSGLHLP